MTSKGFGENTATKTYTVNASGATFSKGGTASTLGAVAVGDTIMAEGALSGTTLTATTIRDGVMGGRGGEGMMGGRGVVGTVASVSGNTITVTSKMGPNGAATTYMVDATGAKVNKSGTVSTLSAIVVGDTVMVQGTVSGTSVVATTINDGPKRADEANLIKGNGQPIVGGKVTAVTGSSLTVTNQSNVTYTIDVTSATITKAGAVSSLSNIVVGDSVVVQGTINGSAVVATSVMDQGPVSAQGTTGSAPHMGGMRGIFGAIGGFFGHLFGF